jgi:hypothetical protein
MTRQAPNASDRNGIRERLAAYANEVHGGWDSFQNTLVLERTTVSGWKRKRGKGVPDVRQLLTLGRRGNLSLNWLLLDQAPMLLGTTDDYGSLGEEMRGYVVGHLRATEGATADQVDVVVPDERALMREVVGLYGGKCKERLEQESRRLEREWREGRELVLSSATDFYARAEKRLAVRVRELSEENEQLKAELAARRGSAGDQAS